MDISNLTVAELTALQKNAQALIEAKKKQSIKDCFEKVITLLADNGLTPQDFIDHLATSKKTNKKIGGGFKKPVQARYRSKVDANDTWTGRGKQPRWLVAELQAGAVLDDLLIGD